MKTQRLSLIVLCILANTFVLGQNSGKFRHRLSQKTINRYNFVLQQKITTKDTVILQKAIAPNTIISTVAIVDRTTTNLLTLPQPRKCIVTVDKGALAVDFWQLTSSSTAPAGVVQASTPTANIVLSDQRTIIGQPTRVIRIPFFAWSWALGTTPLRYRPAQDSSTATVSSALGLSLSYGPSFGRTTFTSRTAIHRSITPAVFVGLSTADIKKETVRTPKIWEQNKTANRTNMAVSYGLSLTFARNNLGAVVSFGVDSAVGPKSGDWSYNNKPWIGLGINAGLGIFR
jgi:hypothetical protein